MPKVTYKNSGVNIDAQDSALKEVKKFAKRSFTKNVVSDIGLFGGLYSIDKNKILVASADGVGTKIKVALKAGIYDTVGCDLVNHCVNDILAQGAKPLFFLDYFAAGKLEPAVLVEVVKGLSKACKENHCSLIGGETAEMPGIYKEGDFDLAGFIVGIVERKNILPRNVKEGDLLIALPSAGLHTNGYSLVRKLFFEKLKLHIDDYVKEIGGNVCDVLLRIHRSYLKSVEGLLNNKHLKAIAHITGGGITDNLPRVLPENISAEIDRKSWKTPSLFRFIQEKGEINDDEMFRVFNMGVGLILVVDKAGSKEITDHLKKFKEKPFLIGKLVKGEKRVVYI
ncbi:MAG: phosphoribosylformylglycinamidine cyclo-ligase [Acidobacteria bacterium]|nr:phosphoribosylformylglycinamidine cyclo-ligase [Acidobacteriota bacterium]